MPIPLFGDEDLSRDEVIQKYEEYGWTKRLEFDWILVDRRGIPRMRRMSFNADTITCDLQEDVQHMLTFLQLRPTGVIWTCGVCGKSDGPIAEELGRALSDVEITLPQAWEVVRRTGQHPPVGLQRSKGRRGRVRIRE